MIVEIAQTIFFLIIMSIAAELISRGAEVLEKRFGAGFVGAVVLGFITTLPELVFVIIAVRAMEYDIAMGSAIGGNILLFTVGYGMVIVLAFVFHRKSITLENVHLRDDMWYLLISCILILFAALDGVFQWYEGVILICIYVVYVIHQFFESRGFFIFPSESQPQKEEESEPPEEEPIRSKLSVFLLVLGGVLLLLVAEPFVHAIGALSLAIGISPLILSLVVSPLASEMPEKISAFVLTIKDLKGAEMAIANFIGSKVMNNSLLFGVMIIMASFVVGVEITDTSRDILLLLVMMLTTVIGVKLTYDLKLKPKEGILALALYIIAVGAVFIIYNL
ncbi:MAG: sodium:calcium antiporter [Candidatus Hodarchaeota archaeon]